MSGGRITYGVRGFGLIELLVTVSVLTVLLGVAALLFVPVMSRETLRSATYEVQTLLQVARSEAVSRNRDVRFVIDRAQSRFEVWDGNGTAAHGDDVLLRDRRMPEAVVFAHPSLGEPISLEQVGTSDLYQAVFASDGTAASGGGSVFLHGGERFVSVTVMGAGGVTVSRWNGGGWEPL